MKQVMCVIRGNWWNSYAELANGPKYGDVCTVLREVYEDDRLGYILLEYNSPEPFIASAFMPILNSSVEIAEEVMENELIEA